MCQAGVDLALNFLKVKVTGDSAVIRHFWRYISTSLFVAEALHMCVFKLHLIVWFVGAKLGLVFYERFLVVKTDPGKGISTNVHGGRTRKAASI